MAENLEQRLFQDALEEVRQNVTHFVSAQPGLLSVPTTPVTPLSSAMPKPVPVQPVRSGAAPSSPAVPSSVPAPQDSEDGSLLGDIWSGVSWLLDVGNKFVTRPALGYLAKEFSDNPRVRQASSYTEAWNVAMEGHPWLKLLAEIALDPMNLVGVGLVGKVGKVPRVARLLSETPALAKGFAALEAADEILGRVQALPVTGTLAALRGSARGLERLTGKPLFQKTPQALLRERVNRFREALRAAEEIGTSILDPENQIAELARRESVDRLRVLPPERLRAEVSRLDGVSLSRVWDTLSRRTDLAQQDRLLKQTVQRELLQRGLLVQRREGSRIFPELSERMRVHLELDDALLGREFTEEARSALHDILDGFAVSIFASNQERFRDLEEVYRLIRVRSRFEDTAEDARSLFQTIREAALKMLEDPNYVPDMTDEELIVDALRRLNMQPEHLRTWLQRLETGVREQPRELAEEAARWYRDAGWVFARFIPRVAIPEEMIARLVDPNNVDPNYKRLVFLSSGEAKRLNEWLKEHGIRLGSNDPIPEQIFNQAMDEIGHIPEQPIKIDPKKPPKDLSTYGVVKWIRLENPVNPLLDTARQLGLTRASRIDPALAAELGIDLTRVDQFGFLLPEEAAKLVSHLLRQRDLREVAFAAWAAGGKGANPINNLRAVASWPLQFIDGKHPSGEIGAGYDEFRRYLLVGLPGLFGESAFAHWSNYDVPIWFRSADMAKIIDRPGEAAVFADKLLNYANLAREYAYLYDEVAAMKLAGVPESEIREYFAKREQEIRGAALDRWIRRDIAYLAEGDWELAEKIANKSSPEDILSQRVIVDALWRIVQKDPFLSKLYPNKGALQAGLWQLIRIESASEGKGNRSPLLALTRLIQGDRSAWDKVIANWDNVMPSAVVQRDPRIQQYLKEYERRGLVTPREIAEALDALAPWLAQRLGELRGLFRIGDSGPVIEITPFADITTIPHELAHLFRYVQSGADIFTPGAREAEEAFARGVERLLLTGSVPENLREALRRYRRIAEVAYRRGVPREELTPDVAQQLLRDMGIPATAPPQWLRETVERGEYGILSADRPDSTAEELLSRREELQSELERRGYQVVPVRRVRPDGTEEQAYLVPGLRLADALELGERFAPDGVLLGDRGWIATTGPNRGRVVAPAGVHFSGPAGDRTFEVTTPQGTVRFTVLLEELPERDVQGVAGLAVPEDLRQADEAAQQAVSAGAQERKATTRQVPSLQQRLREIKRNVKRSYEPGDPNPAINGRPLFDPDGRGPLDHNRRMREALFDKAARYLLEGNPWGPGVEVMFGRLDEKTGRVRTLSRRELAHLEWMLQKAGLLDPTMALEARVQFAPRLAQEAAVETGETVRFSRRRPPGMTERPLVTDDLRSVLSQIAAEERLPQDRVDTLAEVLGPVFQGERAPFAAVSLWLPPYRQRVVDILRLGDTASVRREVSRFLRDIGESWAAFGVEFPNARRIIDKILPRNRATPRRVTGQLARSFYGSPLTDEQVQVLREARDIAAVRQAEEAFQSALGRVREIAVRVREQEPLAPDLSQPTATLRDLAVLRRHVGDAERQVIDDLFRQIGIDPEQATEAALGNTIRQAREELLVEQYAEAMAKKLGVHRDPVAIRALNQIAQALPLRAWREQALLTPRYHLQNLLDSTVKAALTGINPLVGRSAFTIAEKLGIQVPDTVLWRPQTVFWEEFASPEAETALGTMLGRVSRQLGAGAERLVQFNRRVAQAMESAFRSAAWVTELLRHLEQERDQLDAILRAELPRSVAERVIRKLDDTEYGVLFSAQQLADAIQRAGGSAEASARIAAAWNRLIQAASRRGEELAQKLFFDYGDERNIERWIGIRAWAPFHFWATRNVPFYLETLGQHPWLLRVWESYASISEEERKRLGLPARFTGMMPVPFLGFLFGPGTAYANPLVALSIADQLKYRYIPDDAPLLARLQEQASRFGFGLAPWIEIPLGVAGVWGDDWEPMRVLRHSGMVAALTGIDVEEPLRRGIRALRGQPQTVSGSEYEDYLIRKRILELSLEETGRAAHPDYVAALGNPESPIWQRAAADVRRQLLAQEAVGMTVPVPVKYLPETEAAIRQARAMLPEQLPRGRLSQLARAGEIAGAYAPLSWDPRALVLEQKVAALAMLPPGALVQALESDPELRDYVDWAARQPVGASVSPSAYYLQKDR